MAVSFVTRFRRQLATIPFVIVLMVPLALVTWMWLGHKAMSAPASVDVNVETLCVEADRLAGPVIDGCEFTPEITSTE